MWCTANTKKNTCASWKKDKENVEIQTTTCDFDVCQKFKLG